MVNKSGIKEFLCSKIGSYVLIGACALVSFLIIALLTEISPYLCIILIIPCFYYGWNALQRIQPAMFLWLPLIGWLFYFFVKGLLACFIGYFVTVYKLGIMLSDKIKKKIGIQ